MFGRSILETESERKMREPTTQEIWEHEDRFSAANSVDNVSIDLTEADVNGWCASLSYDIIEDNEVIDTVMLNAFLWLDTVEGEFHLNTDGKVY
jgi:hypothetical protein